MTEKTHKLDLDKLSKIYPNAYFDMYFGCNEPGYDDQIMLLANWNHVPNHVFDKLESLGFMCEWSDEWSSCSECGKGIRTSPNSYEWAPAYQLGDGEILCLDCIDPSEYYESLENNPNRAVTTEIAHKYPPEDYGYTLVTDDYVNGFHPGQDDDPKVILKNVLTEFPENRYLFVITFKAQFDMGFALYRKN